MTSTWEHPNGSGPVDKDATLEFVMPPMPEITPMPDMPATAPMPEMPATALMRETAPLTESAPMRAYAQYGASSGYGVDAVGLPDGPIAGRSYNVVPQAAYFTEVEAQAAEFGANTHAEAQATWSQLSDGSWAQTPQNPQTVEPIPAYSDLPSLYGIPTETPNRLSLIALVLAGLAILILPAGLAAMFFASMARNRTEPLGPMSFTIAAGASVVGCLVGVIALVTLIN